MAMAKFWVKSLFLSVIVVFASHEVFSQVCSPPGQLCSRTTDCCRGCCEQYVCVERGFSCSPDLVAQPGSASCQSHFCPPNQMCYLREICPPENPCPRLPFCRPIITPNPVSRNHTDHNGTTGGIHGNSKGFIITAIIFCLTLGRILNTCGFEFESFYSRIF